jgi:hypothetical protein
MNPLQFRAIVSRQSLEHSKMNSMTLVRLAALVVAATWSSAAVSNEDLTQWRSLPPESKPVAVSAGSVTLSSGDWSSLVAPNDSANIDVQATVTIENPATQFDYFGSSWSVWPDPKVGDRGFEAAVLLRSKKRRIERANAGCDGLSTANTSWKVSQAND